MNSASLSINKLREVFESIPGTVEHHGTEPPSPYDMYVVPNHERALSPETTIVVGDRGVGKSFWGAALNGEITRKLIGQQIRRLDFSPIRVSWGFSAAQGMESHPSRRVLQSLRQQDFAAEDIWRTVVLSQLMNGAGKRLSGGSWQDYVAYVSQRPEEEEKMLKGIDEDLLRQGRQHLIIFDALERTGGDWNSIRELMRGLLRVCLDLRSYRGIKTKLFMRPDMWEDHAIWSFPDSSKLQHNPVKLEWRRIDLYGLLFHRIANHSSAGADFRGWYDGMFESRFRRLDANGETVYAIPQPLRMDESVQEKVLNSIASRYMGRDRRRGKTYTWLPTHLADAKGQVSPRSFLLALKEAERYTRERGIDQAIHFEGVKQGVQIASKVRREELQEDYQWIQQVLEPLHGMTVPCTADDLKERWQAKQVVENIVNRRNSEEDDDDRSYLPPHALEQQASGEDEGDAVIETLIEIGVMSRLADGRLNIPDVFRVAAGIGRKGGVKAIR